MPSYICPTCKEINEEHRNYCKACGNWLLSTNYPAVATKEKATSIPKWFMIVLTSLSGLFFLIALITLTATKSIGNGFYSVMIFFGLSGLVTVFVCFFIALFIKHVRRLKKQFFLSTLAFIVLLIFGASMFSNTQSQPSSLASVAKVDSIPTLAEYKAHSTQPNPRDLARSADDSYKGKQVQLKGTIVQVIGKEENQLRVNLNEDLELGTFKEPITIFVTRKDDSGKLLNGDEVEIFGTVLGYQSYKAWTGVEQTIPSVESHYINLIEKK
ncbi:hypothetical protein [Paenibacillus odorifer]|uniref:hypothetical protein n=1 Tax=Paenibacillus TaxID=44249 RepID=UPI00096BEB81|nr:hypothetical protein [Paenibacillus odorifer]OMC98849.1 hypothetical protein BJP46_03765 [Paenibacillus odorifer]